MWREDLQGLSKYEIAQILKVGLRYSPSDFIFLSANARHFIESPQLSLF